MPTDDSHTLVDPIEILRNGGWTDAQMAVAWGLRSTDSVRKLRIFKYVPSYDTAKAMAATFGWSSAGEVIDYWAVRVEARKASGAVA
jgi:hypothetical protein